MGFNAIVMSGMPGSGKTSLLEMLHCKLGWEQHGIGKFLRRDYAQWCIENPGKAKEITFTDYYSNRKLVTDEQIIKLNAELRQQLPSGKILGDSRFAVLNAADLPNVLTVYLHAPLDVRAARSLVSPHQRGASLKAIMANLEKRQADESQRGKEIYGSSFDCHDTTGYALVINNKHLTIMQEADVILSLLEKPY